MLIHVFERHKQLKFPNLEKERAVSWEASKPFSHGSLLRGWTETVKGRKRHSETAPLIPVVCVGSEGSLCPAGRGERKHLALSDPNFGKGQRSSIWGAILSSWWDEGTALVLLPAPQRRCPFNATIRPS